MPEMNLKLDEKTEIVVRYDSNDILDVDRCDFIPVKIGSIEKTDEGFLQGSAPVAKVGILTYMNADGTTRKELVPAETLFNADSMRTLQMKPMTNLHPEETLLDSRTVKRRKIGSTGETTKQDGEFLKASFVITDQDAIDDVDKGRMQLSPGYRASVVMQSGNFQGEHFDAIQVNRKYNHLALCDRARGGANIRLHLDEKEIDKCDSFEYIDNKQLTINKGSKFMENIKLDGCEYQADKQVLNALDRAKTDAEEKSIALTDAKAKNDELQAKLDTANAKIEGLEKVDNTEEIGKAVKARLSLERTANDHLDKEDIEKIDSLTDGDVKKKIILKAFPKADAQLEGKSDDYLSARFDSACELLEVDKKGRKDSNVENRKKIVDSDNSRTGSDTYDPEKSRQDMIDNMVNPNKEVKK